MLGRADAVTSASDTASARAIDLPEAGVSLSGTYFAHRQPGIPTLPALSALLIFLKAHMDNADFRPPQFEHGADTQL